MRRTAIIAVTGWLAAAAAATVAGVAAVTLIGQGLAGPGSGEALSQDEIARELGARPSPVRTGTPGPGGGTLGPGGGRAGPGPTGSPPAATPVVPGDSPGAARSKLLSTPGGTVIARCAGGQVTLQSWSPAQGYAVGEIRPGPDHEGRVTFERGEDEIEARVWCRAGIPSVTWERD